MARPLFAGALFAGLAAGLIAALLHFLLLAPLLLEGELYETGARVHFSAAGAGSPAGSPLLWADMGRQISSFAMIFVTYAGYALLLSAAMAVAVRSGRGVTLRSGMIWGLCGFIATALAPAVALPPELPGTVGAALASRQIWWLGAAGASAVGLGLIGLGRGSLPVVIGILLLAAPHLIGAPRLDAYSGVAPPELASHYVTRVLGVSALAWTVMGAVAGWFWEQADQPGIRPTRQ